MRSLSNLFGRIDAPPEDVQCRSARPEETRAALELIAGGAGGAQDLAAMATQRGIDLSHLWVAGRGGQIVWAILALPNAGRTMMLLVPRQASDAIPLLAEAVLNHFATRGIQLAEILLDPGDHALQRVLTGCGFTRLAELVYLQKIGVRAAPRPDLPPRFTWQTYSPQTHDLFRRAILRSYERSLDCPLLNGMRDIEDIIAGHRATGEFDPQLWFVLTEADDPRGVLLLSRTIASEAMELVYLGVAAGARGAGLGDLLMRQALSRVVSAGRSHLCLAVDATNSPALRLYQRHGMRTVCSRIALLRDLRRGK